MSGEKGAFFTSFITDAAERSVGVALVYLLAASSLYLLVPELLHVYIGDLGIVTVFVFVFCWALVGSAAIALWGHARGLLPEGKAGDTVLGVIQLATAALVIALPFILRVYGQCRPGALYERADYTAKLYVNLFPGGSKDKNYRLPASIHAYFEDGGEGSHSFRVYDIEEAYFPNGGRATFGESPGLKLGRRVEVLDDSGRRWEAELTAEPAQ